jgi:hypothetical protein
VLRTTVLYFRDRAKVVLNGHLVGEWADCLPKAIDQCCPGGEVEIHLDGITCADRNGEQALLDLSKAHRRFVCASPFARALCAGLGIPVEVGER